MQYVRIPLDALILFKGISKDGVPYEFLRLDNDFRNNKGNIQALVAAGVQVSDKTPSVMVESGNAPAATAEAQQEALTLA